MVVCKHAKQPHAANHKTKYVLSIPMSLYELTQYMRLITLVIPIQNWTSKIETITNLANKGPSSQPYLTI